MASVSKLARMNGRGLLFPPLRMHLLSTLASSTGSFARTRVPDSGLSVSREPPTSVTTAGIPQDWASSGASGSPSFSDGWQ